MINRKMLLKYLGIIAFVILLSSVVVRILSGGDSLSDYARKNPDIAYAPHEGENKKEDKADSSGKSDTVSPNGNSTLKNTDVTSLNGNSTLENTDVASLNGNSTSGNTDAASTPESTVTSESDSTTDSTVKETQPMNENRIVYQDGFYYEPLPQSVIHRITGISYHDNPDITYDDLRYVKVLYHDFDEETQIGELICNQAIAQDLVEIFYELYLNDYQIERISLVDEYQGDDVLSMEANNTSCFNYRVVDGTTRLSKHALGLAIDINPFYNPYVIFNRNGSGETYISPKGSEIYADRSIDFPYKIDTNDLCYRLFKEHGFTWGGDWNSTKDYQHFQKKPE